jgi:DNA-binding IscR family transcriptional regulator
VLLDVRNAAAAILDGTTLADVVARNRAYRERSAGA